MAPTTGVRKRSRDPSQRANWRTPSSWRTIFIRWIKERSRISRLSARLWAAPRSTRHNDSRVGCLGHFAKRLTNRIRFFALYGEVLAGAFSNTDAVRQGEIP